MEKLIASDKKFQKAWLFAKLKHQGQKRLTGEDYVCHPLETAKILNSWGLDKDSIVAGLLHDTLEDTETTFEELQKQFGAEVANIVEGVTKVSHIRLKGSQEIEFVENLRKMFLSMAADLRVVLVKLADRLHNMRTLYALPSDKQKKIAKETLEVYAPLAERLGMGEVKSELEDLAFRYAYPKEYKKLVRSAKPHYAKAGKHIRTMRLEMGKALESQSVVAEIQAREKHLFSLWNKLKRIDIEGDFSRINDIVAMRVIVKGVKECYLSLGLIHNTYKPVPSIGISDFIAQPKPNGYRSIHTKVFGPENRIVEIQIRSKKMHEEAEYGMAAHWSYSEDKNSGEVSSEDLEKGLPKPSDKLNWVRQLVAWQEELNDSQEYLEAVKFDALNHRNFIYSPKGDVYDLPEKATPVDFAYRVHTQLGNYIQSAKVDGKMVPLDYQLQSGQIVEIIKSKNPRMPNRDWLASVKTTVAKREIKKAVQTVG